MSATLTRTCWPRPRSAWTCVDRTSAAGGAHLRRRRWFGGRERPVAEEDVPGGGSTDRGAQCGERGRRDRRRADLREPSPHRQPATEAGPERGAVVVDQRVAAAAAQRVVEDVDGVLRQPQARVE